MSGRKTDGERARRACQTLVAALGSIGPESIESAAERAAARIAELEGVIGDQVSGNTLKISWSDAVGCPFTALEAVSLAGDAQCDDPDVDQFEVRVGRAACVVDTGHQGELNHWMVRLAEEGTNER